MPILYQQVAMAFVAQLLAPRRIVGHELRRPCARSAANGSFRSGARLRARRRSRGGARGICTSRQLRWMRPLTWQLPQRVRALGESHLREDGRRRAAAGNVRPAPRNTRAPARAASRGRRARSTAGRSAQGRRSAPRRARAPRRLAAASAIRRVNGSPRSMRASPSAQRRGAARRTCHSSSLRSTHSECLCSSRSIAPCVACHGAPTRSALFVDQYRDRAAPQAALDRVADERAFEREMRAADDLLLPEGERQLELTTALSVSCASYPSLFFADPLFHVAA